MGISHFRHLQSIVSPSLTEWVHSTITTKVMFGYLCMELISGKIFSTFFADLQFIGGDHQVEDSFGNTDGTVAVDCNKSSGCFYLKLYSTTVTASFVYSCVFVLFGKLWYLGHITNSTTVGIPNIGHEESFTTNQWEIERQLLLL